MVAEPLLEKEHRDSCTPVDFDLLRIRALLLLDLQRLQIETDELARQEAYNPRAFQPCQRFPLLSWRPRLLVHYHSFRTNINISFCEIAWRRWLHYQASLLRIQPESQVLCQSKMAYQDQRLLVRKHPSDLLDSYRDIFSQENHHHSSNNESSYFPFDEHQAPWKGNRGELRL